MKRLIDIIQEKLVLSKKVHEYSKYEYFYHEALEDGYTTRFIETKNFVQYSIDNCITWNDLEYDTETPEINQGERIYFKGENMNVNKDNGIGIFQSNKKFNAGGNIMSLIYDDDFEDQTKLLKSNQFAGLFRSNKYLVSCEDLILPATKLVKSCYENMFYGCTSLNQAPELPAIKLSKYCYSHMFANCKSLIKAPKLPAKKLNEYCYLQMFMNCTLLDEAPELPATNLDYNCYDSMFMGCSSLTKVPELPATSLAYSCYDGMFSNCTSLTVAPKLLASSLSAKCYRYMFAGCTSLNEITMLATDTTYESLLNWVYNVSSSGTFIKAKGFNLPEGNNGIPNGWAIKEI